jgi:hypothetical protein
MTVTVKQLEREIYKCTDMGLLLAGCRSTIHELAHTGKEALGRIEELIDERNTARKDFGDTFHLLGLRDKRIEELEEGVMAESIALRHHVKELETQLAFNEAKVDLKDKHIKELEAIVEKAHYITLADAERILKLEGFIDAYCGQPDQTKVFDEFKAIRDKNTELEAQVDQFLLTKPSEDAMLIWQQNFRAALGEQE